MKKLTTEEIIKRAKEIHGDKYDYSQVEYKNNCSKVKIKCPKHGIFEQKPNNHLRGQGCPKCGGTQKKTTEEFILEANKIHNNFYDYSEVKYKNDLSKVKIKCPKHGIFEQVPSNHLQSKGCSSCGENKKKTSEEFILEASKIHNNFYDYRQVEYKNAYSKVKIKCPNHGIFEQVPSSHLRGNGCPKCGGTQKKTTLEFILKANEVHNYFYNYSEVKYKNNHSKVKIKCPKHGIFEQAPSDHLSERGCPKCGGTQKKTSEEFILEANKIHNNFYSYRETSYKNALSKVKIKCPKHGIFEQVPSDHLQGKGCPKCSNNISKPEIKWLDSLKIPDDKEHRQVRIKINKKFFRVDRL